MNIAALNLHQYSMKQSVKSSLITFLKKLPDPRVEGRCKHKLVDVAVISVCALLCGAETWVEIAEFGKQRFDWFKRYLKLQNGIPSHDTFARVFSLLKADAFEQLFSEWASLIALSLNSNCGEKDKNKNKQQEHLCIDGKSISGTAGGRRGNCALHLVSLYSHDSGLVLGQLKAESAGGESCTVLECLELLDIEGALVSADAASATKKITRTIREMKADYLIPLKSSSRKYLVNQLQANSLKPIGSALEEQRHHGRTERRECKVFAASKMGEKFRQTWQDVQSVVEITRERTRADYSNNAAERGGIKTTLETTYYISSQNIKPTQAITLIKEHWSIENQLHWQLDVSLREDDWRSRDKKAARSLAVVRKMAFNLLKANPEKASLRVKMKRAAWNQNYLEKIVFNPNF